MKQVYLVYEDDYGGLFSPWFLTQVFADEDEAIKYCKSHKWLSTMRCYECRGLDLSAYPQSIGGLFSDD
jgi:hypothetical protein